MAASLKFKLKGAEYEAVPVKLERKKLYGWTDVVATDASGETCRTAQVDPDGELLIPPGAVKMGILDEDGAWVERSELVAVDADGKELPIVASSFGQTIELGETATSEEFLDHAWKSVYQLGILPDETVEESASARMKLRKDAINGLRDDSVWRTPEGKSKSRPLLAVVLTPGKGLARQMYRLAFLMNLHMIVVLPCDRKSYLERFAAAEREYIEHWLRAAHEIVVAEGSVEDAIRSISRDILVLADGKWTVKSL